MARLLRFLRIEPKHGASGKERAGGESQPSDPDVDAEIERLRNDRKQRFASGMETAETEPQAQPFRRCAVCEADNSRFAERCQNCGVALTTPEQRAYNEALWQKRQAEE